MPQQSDLLAVLVDADNVSPSRIGGVLAEIATYGTASVKRVYGDWTKSQLRGWKDAASEHVIQPMQQFDNTTGKNATDSALIIDAMDLLYTRRFQGFCIVSSDSDFTRLASRIREEGVTVYGFGERKTPEAFRNACDQFTYLEVLGVVDEKDAARSTTAERWTSAALRGDARLVALLRSAAETASADDGWSDLGTVGQLMRKQQPDFDPRNWGYAKLSDLVRAVGLFTIESKPGGMSLRPKTAAGVKGSDDTAADAPAKGRGEARGEAEAGTAGGRSRRKPSRAKGAAPEGEPPARDDTGDSRDEASQATPAAEPADGPSSRNRRPMIEQLTLGAALDAALDAVSSAARDNAAAPAAPSERTETGGAAATEPAPVSDAAETPDAASPDEPAAGADAAPLPDEAPAAGRSAKKTSGRTAAKTSAKSEAATTAASGEAKTRTPRKTGARTAAKRATDADASTETAAPASGTDAASAPAADVDAGAESVPAEPEASSDAPARPKRTSRSRAAAPKTPSDETETTVRPKRAPRSRKAPVTDASAEPAAESRAEEPAAAEPAAAAPAETAAAPEVASAPVKRAPRRASRPGSSAS
ncbi:NYN domain-containing protein [Microbacterium arborescens]